MCAFIHSIYTHIIFAYWYPEPVSAVVKSDQICWPQMEEVEWDFKKGNFFCFESLLKDIIIQNIIIN